MPYVAVTKPLQGEPTRKPLIDAIIDNQAYFQSVISALTAFTVPNGSFELFTNNGSEDLPDEWTRTLYTGGTFAMTGDGRADTECAHGRAAVKFVGPGIAAQGGGFIETEDFLEVTPHRPLLISFLHRSTVAGIRNKCVVTWYDRAQVLVSTAEFYSSITNPTAWTQIISWGIAPATARYCKIKLVGAENTVAVAGTAYFDDVRVGLPTFRHIIKLDVTGDHAFVCPAGVNYVVALLLGPGGGGGGTNSGTTGSGGGGGGGTCLGVVPVVPGTHYIVHVGAKGAGGTAGSGLPAAGNDDPTTFGTLSARGGLRGLASSGGTPGNGGAGGSASGGWYNLTGASGSVGAGTDGGDGGGVNELGLAGAGQTGNGNGFAANAGTGGGGGGGGGTSPNNGGNGSDGVAWIMIP